MKEIIKSLIPDLLLGLRGQALHVLEDVTRIPEMVDETDAYYPSADHKRRCRIVLENMWWRWHHRQLNTHYFLFGLDRKTSSFDDYLSHPEFVKLRDRGNDERYAGILKDKFIFARLADSLGYPTPNNIALLEPGGLKWLSPKRENGPFVDLLNRDIAAVCKPSDGGQGRGVFLLRTDADSIYIDGEPASIEALRARITERYVVQERIEQHRALSALHPASVNTLRLITARKDGDIVLLSSVLRVGAAGSHTDNWSTGGLIAYIKPETGITRLPGVFKYGQQGIVSHHPDTGISLDGYPIPYFHEAVDLVRAIHYDLSGLSTVG